MNRRRFLTITAAAFALPQGAKAAIWQGRALGADARITLHGLPDAQAALLWPRIEALIDQIEATFSLHRTSELTRLNTHAHLANPSQDFRAVMALSGKVHAATNGSFDPTIQPLWRAIATNGDVKAAQARIGWHRIRQTSREIRLAPGMALTFNGIAQGFAADRVAALLRKAGLSNVLVDMGEVIALGQSNAQPWRAAIADAKGRITTEIPLTNRALATSSPKGTLIGQGQPHILHPAGIAPYWALASVSAPTAALADALSTAFCLMEKAQITEALTVFPETRLEVLS